MIMNVYVHHTGCLILFFKTNFETFFFSFSKQYNVTNLSKHLKPVFKKKFPLNLCCCESTKVIL